jgi:hypothetical protein
MNRSVFDSAFSATSRLDCEIQLDLFLLQPAIHASPDRFIGTFLHLVAQSPYFSQSFDLQRNAARIFKKGETDPLIFRPAEILVKIERLACSGQFLELILGQPFSNELIDGIRHTSLFIQHTRGQHKNDRLFRL